MRILRASARLLKGEMRKVALACRMRGMFLHDPAIFFLRMRGFPSRGLVIFQGFIMDTRFLLTSTRLVQRFFGHVSPANSGMRRVVNWVQLVQVKRFFCPFRAFLNVMAVRIMRFGSICRTINVAQIDNVAYLLRTAYPSLMVHGLRAGRGNVTYSHARRFKVIAVQVLNVAVDPGAFVQYVIINACHPSIPTPSTLSARVIIQLTNRIASSNSQLRRSLYRYSANQGVVALRLLRYGFVVLPSMVFMHLVLTLDYPRERYRPYRATRRGVFR